MFSDTSSAADGTDALCNDSTWATKRRGVKMHVVAVHQTRTRERHSAPRQDQHVAVISQRWVTIAAMINLSSPPSSSQRDF
jgi:hypothetical protein